MSAVEMTSQPHGRHRLGVLPGLGSRSGTASAVGNVLQTNLATMDEISNNRQLVPLATSDSKLNLRNPGAINWNRSVSIKSRDSDENVGCQIHSIASRMGALEEANKAILEEVYRLQSNVRAGEFSKKEMVREEKKVQHDLMDTIRASNDIISQLTSRLRKAEEKLHQERENIKNLFTHSKQIEQALYNAQREAESHHDTQNSQTGDLRHRLEDLSRRWDKSDRTSENIVDEFHQLKNKVEMQSMEFSHLKNEMKQRSKRTEEEIKQSLQQAKLQKDTTSIAEQNNLQLRHMLEARIAETRDTVSELRNRITQTESSARSQTQQIAIKITDLQSDINNLAHRRQEELQTLQKSRQEHDHSEENERMKLQNKIQTAVEEMSEKLLQKEVRLREEALKKFIDVEKLFQQEESARVEFEKHLREDTEARWNLQQKLYNEEMQAIKEMRRNDRTRLASNMKKIDDCLMMLDKKINHDRKSLEKVLMAEITKREYQSTAVKAQLDGVQEHMRMAVSTLQQAIGGVQFKTDKDKDHVLGEMKKRFAEEESKLSRALTDVDARLTAISMRMTQQDQSSETRFDELKRNVKEQHNDLLRSANEWRSVTDNDVASIRESLKAIPQSLRETEERLDLVKTDIDTRLTLENESRLKDADVVKKQLRQLSERSEQFDSYTIKEKSRQEKLMLDVIAAQGTIEQMERLVHDIKSNLGIRVNSETKMRLEETSAIKREIAKLRVEIQPLLWQHNVTGRTFVKKPTSFLNEWGIYQCARWYDIKMRWMRLLGRRKKQKKPVLPVKKTPEPPKPVQPVPSDSGSDFSDIPMPTAGISNNFPRTENEQNSKPDEDLDRRPPSEGRISSIDLHGNSEDRLSPHDDAVPAEEQRNSPLPAWYNQEKVGVDEREGAKSKQENNSVHPENEGLRTESEAPIPEARSSIAANDNVGDAADEDKRSLDAQDMDEKLENQRLDDDNSPEQDNIPASPQDGGSAQESESLQPSTSDQHPTENGAGPRKNSGEPDNKSGSKTRSGSKSKNKTPPGVSRSGSNLSTGRRTKAKPSPTGTGEGKSYDMEGSR